tara:strand:- start:880 stop:1683 length:804 start_codon:yes stop_codon:yes gene_type:complete
MHNFRKYIEGVNLRTLIDNSGDTLLQELDASKIRSHFISGFDKLLSLEDSCKGKKAIVMGHGPTLLQTNKEDYEQHVKITCNDFQKISFFDDFVPDFWCAANSHDALKEPFEACMDKGINVLISVPRKYEFLKLLEIAEEKEKLNLVSPWLWEIRMFQLMLAKKYKCSQPYSHCNTVTNHMIAFALWLGCDSIDVTGFDMSYTKALEKTGRSHAGVSLLADISGFESDAQQNQILGDLKYLCNIASESNIVINNLSYDVNGLTKILS